MLGRMLSLWVDLWLLLGRRWRCCKDQIKDEEAEGRAEGGGGPWEVRGEGRLHVYFFVRCALNAGSCIRFELLRRIIISLF